ncbi:hypothetical protein B0H63DRAFT_544825 [Podospora didyma]|uniref:Erythromycin biosynthesis protein CIII-like C-terminal domain-containing protein n=1 Tax=Podospora didyma TaxID=330526 RepID=A0AAE0NR49_9PEZI|nr:hypothetical protein B0H63DRAFT_544825 [Podospora didyma]
MEENGTPTPTPAQPAAQQRRSKKRILFITNIERGQANVFLATSHALLQIKPAPELHFATFTGLEAEVSSTSQHAILTASPHLSPAEPIQPITFHTIRGPSGIDGMQQYYASRKTPKRSFVPDSFVSPLNFFTTLRAIHDTMPIFFTHDGPQTAEVVASIIEIIKQVDADLVVVDCVMTAALTACQHLGVKFACLSPNSILDMARSAQPYGASFLRFPVMFSGFSYPVPWYLKPLNILYILYVVSAYLRFDRRRETVKYLAQHMGAKLRTPIDLSRDRPVDLKLVVGCLAELDFPGIHIPAHVVPCGPIIRDSSGPPISEADSELCAWLAKRPTLYVNLGTLCQLDEDRAVELARALRLVLVQAPQDFQVLWKLKKFGEYGTVNAGCRIHDVLGKFIDADLVRIVGWLVPEPISILWTGHVACSVHQGGANSYYEAIIAGVPQVVLPQWIDCYLYAERVEYLGMGRVGNRKAKPLWTAEELATAILDVLFGKDSEAIRQKARELAEICKRNGNGAENAARILLAECDVSNKKGQ